MSITNLKKTFENNLLVYCNLFNGYIIECVCLTETYSVYKYNRKFEYFMCNKVKIITIYDIYKNIISEPIQNDFLKDTIKINGILENLKYKKYYFFKTFIGAFIKNNKLNDIEYNIDYNNIKFIYNNNNIYIDLYHYCKDINIYNNKGDAIYNFCLHDDIYDNTYGNIYCYENKNNIEYDINYCIKINITKKLYFFNVSLLKKDLKVFEIEEYYRNNMIYYEKRNYNNEIVNCKKINNNIIKEEFISNNINPPFSKPLKKNCIELINHYNKNIHNFIKIIKSLLKQTKEIYYNLLLNYYLEMISFKQQFNKLLFRNDKF